MAEGTFVKMDQWLKELFGMPNQRLKVRVQVNIDHVIYILFILFSIYHGIYSYQGPDLLRLYIVRRGFSVRTKMQIAKSTVHCTVYTVHYSVQCTGEKKI